MVKPPKDSKNNSNAKEKGTDAFQMSFLVHFNCDYANKSSFSDAIVREEVDANEPELESDLKMFGEEQKQMGKLSWAVYCSFWRAVGGCLAVAVLLSLFLMQGTNNYQSELYVL